MRSRRIPRSDEALPVIGLGTWSTFDVGPGPDERQPLADVLADFFAAGGRLIDSSPMYGRAEAVVGDLVSAAKHPAFLATKVWTQGAAQGRAQMETSLRLLRADRIDLMQVHNLLDWKAHLPTLREWKAAGRFRYLGITHYAASAFGDLERLMRTEALDFVQLPYSLGARGVEARLLPCARDTGTAVLVMRPFEEGALFAAVKGRALPPWLTERGFGSWAQVFLAFLLANPAVACVLPATSKRSHLAQNVSAGSGPELSAADAARLVKDFDAR